MIDNRPGIPRSPLELLENVPESLQRRLKQYSGRLATEAVQVMQERLPFFAGLEASQRASVQLVVQTAVVNFAEWTRNPQSNVGYTAEAFALVPQDLTRRIALRQTVDMVRVTMEYFEEVVPMLARNEEQLTALTVGILRYSRDLAFAAAPLTPTPPRPVAPGTAGWKPVSSTPLCAGNRSGAAVAGRGAELGHHRTGDRGRRHPAARPCGVGQ